MVLSSDRVRMAIVAATLAACCLYPPVHSVSTLGTKAFFSYFAADSFYYFTVAKNAVGGMLFSYDGSTSTNGFHPLWQLLLIVVFQSVGREQPAQLAVTFWMGALLVTLGVVLFGVAIHRLTRSTIAPLWLVPGLFYVLFAISTIHTIDPGLTYTYSVWAFMNGTESPLSILLGGLLALNLSEATRAGSEPASWSGRRWLVLGVLVGLIILSRLDDVFLAAGFGVYILSAQCTWKDRIGQLLKFTLPIVILLGGYIIFCEMWFGMSSPVSGLVKAGLGLRQNFMATLSVLVPALAPPEELEGWVYTAPRVILLVVPAVASTLLLVRWRRRGRDSSGERARMEAFVPILYYVVLKAVYNFAFVKVSQQGYWYYPLSVLFVNFFAVVLLHEVWAKAGAKYRGTIFAAWSLVYLVGSANTAYRVSERNWWYDVWRQRNEIRAGLLNVDRTPKLIGFYDGLFAYSLDLPTVAATALTTDRVGLEALRRGEYPEYCLSRGHDIAVWSPQGYPVPRSWIRRGGINVIYRHPPTRVTFSRIE